MMRVGLNDRAEALLEEAVFAVEATDIERDYVLNRYKSRGLEDLREGGGLVTVGSAIVGGRLVGRRMPVTVQVNYGRHKGRGILFYYGCSAVVDRNQIRAWLDTHGFTGPDFRTDAENAIHALHHIERMVEAA